MNILSSQSIPVPSPISFRDGGFILNDKNLWSLFPFIEGEYFSGVNGELELMIESAAKLTVTLQKISVEQFSSLDGLHYFSNLEKDTLQKLDKRIDSWEQYFGVSSTKLLRESWSIIKREWNRLHKEKIFAGPLQLAHYDLHPHNILIKNKKIVALLDFDACKIIPVGYALAYGALKQCKQTIVASGDVNQASKIGKMYIEKINHYIPSSIKWTKNFYDLAITETLRRLCLIFHLNINSNDTRWNKVLPVLLAHLQEAKILFRSS
jgi:hypothetical protein